MTDQPSTTDVVSPVEGDTTADPRRARVDTARAAWTRHLVDLGGRNTLLWYRDLPTGTLDLTTAHPGGVAMLLAGKPTKLSDLVREPAALDEARRRARAIAAKTRELAQERGILTGFLAIGMASWTVRLPDGRTAPRTPAAPVLLRACTLRATGAAQGDYTLDLDGDLELNPVLVHYLASEQGIALDADAIEALATPGQTFDPYPIYAALAQACADVPDFAVTPRLVLGTFSYAKLPMVADLAAQAETLADHDVVAALAGDRCVMKRDEERPVDQQRLSGSVRCMVQAESPGRSQVADVARRDQVEPRMPLLAPTTSVGQHVLAAFRVAAQFSHRLRPHSTRHQRKDVLRTPFRGAVLQDLKLHREAFSHGVDRRVNAARKRLGNLTSVGRVSGPFGIHRPPILHEAREAIGRQTFLTDQFGRLARGDAATDRVEIVDRGPRRSPA